MSTVPALGESLCTVFFLQLNERADSRGGSSSHWRKRCYALAYGQVKPGSLDGADDVGHLPNL